MNSDKIRTIWNSCISVAATNQTCTCQQSFPSSCDQVMEVFSSSATVAEHSSLTGALCLHIHPSSTHGIAIPFTDCSAVKPQGAPTLWCYHNTEFPSALLHRFEKQHFASSDSCFSIQEGQNAFSKIKHFPKVNSVVRSPFSWRLCAWVVVNQCACVIVTAQQTKVSHKSKVKDHKAHETLPCAEHPTKPCRPEHLPGTTG